MKSLKLLICLLPFVMGMVACGSDDEEVPVPRHHEDSVKPDDPEEEENPTTADELLTTSYVQWVSSSDATLCWEITEKAYRELQEGKIQASFGVAWSTSEGDLVKVNNRLNGYTMAVDFSQTVHSLTRLVSLMSSTTYYYTTYVDMNGELHVAPVRSFMTMDEGVSPGQTPDGVEAVDMGLPSGRKWANKNIGAEKQEDTGLFFAWGETEGYLEDGSDDHLFSWATYKWCKGSRSNQTKYCTNSGYGTIDNKVVLDFADDAAYVNWGVEWRMPTAEEMKELMENTISEWTVLGGVEGYKFTSKTTGNVIFLPAAGCRVSESQYEKGTDCYYWASTVDIENPYASRYLRFYVGRVFLASLFRYYGMNVRPVRR